MPHCWKSHVTAHFQIKGAQWLSGRVLDLRPVSLCCGPRARHICSSLVLVQPRNPGPCLTERLLMGCKESNQTKSFPDCFYPFSEFDMDDSTEDDEFYSDYLGNRKAKKCNHSNMKCTTQTNDQWRTPPYWRGNCFLSLCLSDPCGYTVVHSFNNFNP